MKITFSSKLTKISNFEIDQYISLAGLEKLKPLMPQNINLENNPDLVGACLNAAVAGYANLNGDCITNEAALNISKNFVWKYVDYEHKRNKIIGVICNYGFSEFGTNNILTEGALKDYKKPFNISLAVLLYRAALSDEFLNILEQSADENSDLYGKISASWELYFNDYDIAVGPRDVNLATIITDEQQKNELSKKLQCNGGSGRDDNNYIYRVINENNLIPGGIGLVESPAAFVSGLTIFAKKNEDVLENSIKNSVTNNKDIDKKQVMESKTIKKIESLDQISNENLVLTEASAVVDFVKDEIRKASEKYVEEKNKYESLSKELEQKNKEMQNNLTSATKTIKELTDQMTVIQTRLLAKEQEDLFNQRMSFFDSEYNLSDEERGVIASEIKDLDKEKFEAYSNKLMVFLKDKKRSKESTSQTIVSSEQSLTVASTTTESTSQNTTTVVENALNNATKDTTTVANTTVPEETLLQKYSKYFKIGEGVKIIKR